MRARLGGAFPYLCGAGAILCWASLAAAIGKSLQTLPPETVLFYGLLVAGLALWAGDALRTGRLLPGWPGWRGALYGVYGIWGYHTLLVVAFSMAPQMEANVLNYTWTLWIVLFGSLLPGNRFSAGIALGGLLGFAGVVWVLTGSGGAGEAGGSWGQALDWGVMPGFLLALAAGVCWGSFTAFLRLAVPGNAPRMALFCLLAAATAAAFLALRGAPWVLPLAQAGPVIYMGLVPLGLSFILWEQAARHCQVQILGMMSFFTPVLSTLILALMAGRVPPAGVFGGLVLIMAGAALGSRGLRRG